MPTTKLNLPLIDGTNTADVVRDMNALANAVDNKAGASDGLATLDASGKVPASQLNVSAPADATTSTKGVVQLSNSTTSTSETLAATPKAVKDVKDALDTHTTNTSNPHSVTKAQVGLGSVENYAVATQAEAQAGTVTNKYMTPQRTKQAIDSQTGDRSTLNTTAKTTLVAAINELFTSVSDGKTQIATAITDKGVTASGGDTFPTLATKIGQISSEVTGETVRTLTAGVSITKGERVEYTDMQKLSDLPNVPASSSYGVSFSGDGVYMASVHTSSPYLSLYKRSGDTFTKLTDPSVIPPSTSYGCSFSDDGVYLAVVSSGSPYLSLYKRSGDTFTKLANPATNPTGIAYRASFSQDGTYLAVAHATSPFMTIYKRSGDTFTKLANPSVLPGDGGQGCAFSSDGIYLSVTFPASPYVAIYKRSGDTFTKLANPSIIPTQYNKGVAFSQDTTYLCVGKTIYKRSGDTFTKLASPSGLPNNEVTDAAFNSDGTKLLMASLASAPYLTVYKRSGDTFTKLNVPSVLPTGNARGVATNRLGGYSVVGYDNAPYITVYKDMSTVTKNAGVVAAGKSLGYAKTSASSGQNVDVAVLFE